MRHRSSRGVKHAFILATLISAFFAAIAAASAGPVVPIPATLWQPPSACVPPSGDYVLLISDPGDWVGDGRAYLYTAADAVLKTSISDVDGHLKVDVTGDEYWHGDFEPMSTLSQLEPGYYPDLERYPFHNPTKGGLDWYGEGRGSNTLSGWFVVDSVTYSGATLTSIDLRFELHSDAGTPALHGAIHLGGATPAPKALTTLALAAPTTCRYGSAKLGGTLQNAATQQLANRSISILYNTGGSWRVLSSATTDAGGAYVLPADPVTATTYQAIYAGSATDSGSTSDAMKVLPGVFLSKPSAPRSTRTTASFLCSCTLKPRHPAGSHPVQFDCQHRQSGRWISLILVSARAADSAAGSKCSAKIRLTTRGAWRIRAVHQADDGNAATATGWKSVTVH